MAKTPKVVQLLKLMKVSELNDLRARLINGNQERMRVLMEELLKLKNQEVEEKEKKQLYERLFGEAYTASKDYRLRNEYRLLSLQIEQLLAETEVQEQLEKNETAFHYYLLQSLQKRKALDLFQKEYASSYDQALEHQDYYAAHNISGLNFINFTQLLNLKEKDIAYIEKLNELRLTHLSCYYLTAFRQHQIDNHYVHNNLISFSTEEQHLEEKVTVDFQPYETNYSDYLFFKAKSFVVPLSEQIELLKQCLDLAEHYFAKNSLVFQKEMEFCFSTLGKAHSIATRFEEANQYLEKFFDLCEDLEDPQRLAVMADYIANHINLFNIKKAIHLLEENELYVNNIPRLQLRWASLETACYAFVEDAAKLYDCLLKSTTFHTVPAKHFFRFYFAIHAWLEQRSEDAYREIENLRHLTSGKTERGFDIHPAVNLFHRYFYAFYHYPFEDNKRQANLQKLSEDVREYAVTARPEMRSYLPFLWLKRKLEQ